MHLTRRDLLAAGAAASLGLPTMARPSAGFLAVSSANGMRTVEEAVRLMKEGADTLDAAIAGVNIVELDPNDTSVGYGGLPNEDGIVELDASCMHGPTYRGGAVASLRNIKTPSKVAQLVLQRTDHCLLVAEGALRFAKMHGFKEEDLLTERARIAWVRWKENLSVDDDYIAPDSGGGQRDPRPTGTITCLCLNDKTEISGVTTTSGLAFKIPGRVGDSPLLGCGVYVENEVGACGSTGRGEANILENGSRVVVENMKRGMSPEAACVDVLKRICARTVDKRLLRSPGVPDFQLQFYALNKAGQHGAACIHPGSRYAVNDGSGAKLMDCTAVLGS
jgi:N4-(beta-N-acetylglucosaminyl)-L-asparaginase